MKLSISSPNITYLGYSIKIYCKMTTTEHKYVWSDRNDEKATTLIAILTLLLRRWQRWTSKWIPWSNKFVTPHCMPVLPLTVFLISLCASSHCACVCAGYMRLTPSSIILEWYTEWYTEWCTHPQSNILSNILSNPTRGHTLFNIWMSPYLMLLTISASNVKYP